MGRRAKRRSGFTLIDVALATVIITIGTITMAKFFSNIYDQLSPRGDFGGLRRYILAEQMIKAQAEGLRLLQVLPILDSQLKLVTEPAGLDYALTVTRFPVSTTELTEQIYYYDIQMVQNGQTIGTISMSTLRTLPGTLDDKIGL